MDTRGVSHGGTGPRITDTVEYGHGDDRRRRTTVDTRPRDGRTDTDGTSRPPMPHDTGLRDTPFGRPPLPSPPPDSQ